MNDQSEACKDFLLEMLNRITRAQSKQEFIFISKGPGHATDTFPQNVKLITAGPSGSSVLAKKYWLDLKLPSILKKLEIDEVVSFNGVCSLATQLPQCLVANDLFFVQHPGYFKKADLLYYKYYTPKFFKKAKRIIWFSQKQKDVIAGHYRIDPAKIDIVPPASSELYLPLNEEKKQTVKAKLTGGREYFAYTGHIGRETDFIPLLKAFSIFKKRQASNLKLIIASRTSILKSAFVKRLETYKYKEDVLVLEQVSEVELIETMGAAYALIFLPLRNTRAMPALEAMGCQVPIIAPEQSAIEELAKDAALYANPKDHVAIADKMMILYKDENFRSQLIDKGKKIVGEFSWERSAAVFWDCLVKTTA